MTFSLVAALLLALIGVVLWLEGGPHPRRPSGFSAKAVNLRNTSMKSPFTFLS